MSGGVGKPGQMGAAGDDDGLLHVGPWGGQMWLRGAPAWAVLQCSHPLEKGPKSVRGMTRNAAITYLQYNFYTQSSVDTMLYNTINSVIYFITFHLFIITS